MTVIISILILTALFTGYAYNRIIRQVNLRKEGWSGIDVQLRRRHELIPNLVEIVKSYKDYESETLEEVVKLRTLASDKTQNENNDIKNIATREQAVGSKLKQLLARVEAYPELKASSQFSELHLQLVAIEDDLQYARRYYNGCVRNLNTTIEMFPTNIVASLFGFRVENFFELEYATERNSPDISFD